MGSAVPPGPRNPLVTKLSRFVSFSDRDLRALSDLASATKRFEARVDIVAEGDVPPTAFVLTEGMACRYRLLSDGRRQILGFIIPGDISDLHGYLLKVMDHSISTIVPTQIAAIARDAVAEIVADHPRIAAALRWCAMQGEAMLREHIVALGRRDARGRVAYMLCELVWRHMANGMSDNHAIRLPLTQIEIADTLGLTPVHVNRVLQDFRKSGLIRLERRRLTLLALPRLQRVAELKDDYLHLGGASMEIEHYLNGLEREHPGRRRDGAQT
jgi:CRP-like cAMP-binding protein